jgi:hypothetical protein
MTYEPCSIWELAQFETSFFENVCTLVNLAKMGYPDNVVFTAAINGSLFSEPRPLFPPTSAPRDKRRQPQ